MERFGPDPIAILTRLLAVLLRDLDAGLMDYERVHGLSGSLDVIRAICQAARKAVESVSDGLSHPVLGLIVMHGLQGALGAFIRAVGSDPNPVLAELVSLARATTDELDRLTHPVIQP